MVDLLRLRDEDFLRLGMGNPWESEWKKHENEYTLACARNQAGIQFFRFLERSMRWSDKNSFCF